MKSIFECQQCGNCCHGDTTVSLDNSDLKRLVAHLELPEPEVFEKYLRRTGSVIQMKTVDGHCIFFDNGCTVHAGKPWRCTQWPLHPSMLTDQANYSAISSSCPGLENGLDYSEFCDIFKKLLKDLGKEENR